MSDPFQPGGLHREHRRQILAMQALDERVKHLTRAAIVAVVAILAVAGKGRERVDEHPSSTNLRGFRHQQAIGLLELLLDTSTQQLRPPLRQRSSRRFRGVMGIRTGRNRSLSHEP